MSLHEFCYIDLYQGTLVDSELSKLKSKYGKYLLTATYDDGQQILAFSIPGVSTGCIPARPLLRRLFRYENINLQI